MPTTLSSSIPGTPDGSDRDISSPGTLPSGQPKRTQRIPENAQPYFAELADKKKERANRAEVQKQKSEASARPNAKQPTPIVEPSGKRRKGYLTNEPIDSSILTNKDELVNETNNKMQTCSVQDKPVASSTITPHSTPKNPKRPYIPTTLKRADLSNHTTIYPSATPNNKQGRDPSRKRLPLSPQGKVLTGSRKDKGKEVERIQTPATSNDHPVHPPVSTPKPAPKNSPSQPALQALPSTSPGAAKALSTGKVSKSAAPKSKQAPKLPTGGATSTSQDKRWTSGPQERCKDANPPAQFQNRAPADGAGPPPQGKAHPAAATAATANQASCKRKKGNNAQGGSQARKVSAKTAAKSQPSQREEDPKEGNEGNGSNSEEGEVAASGATLTKHKAAKLSRFGKIKWLVWEVAKRVQILAFKENPYADIARKLSNPNPQGNCCNLGVLAHVWAAEAWGNVWREKNLGNKLPPKMEDAHLDWIIGRFSNWRHTAKAVTKPYISLHYQLDCNNPPDINKKKVKAMGKDGFLSPTLTPKDHLAFRNEIFWLAIRDGWFLTPGTSIGFKLAKHLQPMPLGIMALIATMLHYHVGLFKTGVAKYKKLNAEQQLPWFNMYMAILRNIGLEDHLGQDLVNWRVELFDRCHGTGYRHVPPVIEMPTQEYPPDTCKVYVSKVQLYSLDSKDSLGSSSKEEEAGLGNSQMSLQGNSLSPLPVEKLTDVTRNQQPVAGLLGTQHSLPPGEYPVRCQNTPVVQQATHGNWSCSSSIEICWIPAWAKTPVDSSLQDDSEQPVEELIFMEESDD
ncbi:hypothetical protein RhiXN_08241 [Rhizoctonia solani]|uniref:DUF6532 domain-containing protein n=1 Tax=Rhizoctonia solani TaxID=456999 RepID=A0A8H8P2I6_9AGAM|nr:uncharacterized protein RhiXN_08241 [Rhizoctonia solani]QRW23205.1 hypothetical protein RhiXN_08241 [Rhizoctonia solani]